MSFKKVAQDTAKVLQSYLTYQAIKTIIDELSQTNPGQAIWLREYSHHQKIQDSDLYIESLMLENKELLLRILTVREYLAEQVLEFLPEMVSTGIKQSNIEHRRHLLERLTQTQTLSSEETTKTDSDSN